MAFGSSKASTTDSSSYDLAVARAKSLAAELAEAKEKLEALEAERGAAALDDPAIYEALLADIAAAQHLIGRLTDAKAEAERRAEQALHDLKMANNKQLVGRCLKSLERKDQLGAEVENATRALAEKFTALVDQSGRCRDQLTALIGLDALKPGFALNAGELESLLAREFWRCDAALPGSEKPVRLDGHPEPYRPDTAPSMSANLKAGSDLAAKIIGGSRNYRGDKKKAPPKKKLSDWLRPYRDKDDARLDEARENSNVVPAELKAAREAHDKRQSEFASDRLKPLPNETNEQWLERVSRPEPITDQERAKRNAPPTRPKVSADQVMAETKARPFDRVVVDARAPKKEDW